MGKPACRRSDVDHHRQALPACAGLLSDATATTGRQAVLATLAFSWLNPHAWLDTAVLIGSLS
jgi:L-lysine exporter family protein LysE/ArgO